MAGAPSGFVQEILRVPPAMNLASADPEICDSQAWDQRGRTVSKNPWG